MSERPLMQKRCWALAPSRRYDRPSLRWLHRTGGAEVVGIDGLALSLRAGWRQILRPGTAWVGSCRFGVRRWRLVAVARTGRCGGGLLGRRVGRVRRGILCERRGGGGWRLAPTPVADCRRRGG